jgi:hypothetical protein
VVVDGARELADLGDVLRAVTREEAREMRRRGREVRERERERERERGKGGRERGREREVR